MNDFKNSNNEKSDSPIGEKNYTKLKWAMVEIAATIFIVIFFIIMFRYFL